MIFPGVPFARLSHIRSVSQHDMIAWKSYCCWWVDATKTVKAAHAVRMDQTSIVDVCRRDDSPFRHSYVWQSEFLKHFGPAMLVTLIAMLGIAMCWKNALWKRLVWHCHLRFHVALPFPVWPGLTFHGLKDATTTWVLPKPKRRGLWSRSQNWRVQSICEAWRAQPIHFLQLNHRSMDLMCSCVLSHQLSASCFAGIAAAKHKARYFQMISTTTKT